MEETSIIPFINSLYYVLYLLLSIGSIWTLYCFFVQKKKEDALKRLLVTVVAASVLFGFAYLVGSLTEYDVSWG